MVDLYALAFLFAVQAGPAPDETTEAQQEVTLVLRHRGRRLSRPGRGRSDASNSARFDFGTLAEYRSDEDSLALCLEEGTSLRIFSRGRAAQTARGSVTQSCASEFELGRDALRGLDGILIVAE